MDSQEGWEAEGMKNDSPISEPQRGWMPVPRAEIGSTEGWPSLREDQEFSLAQADFEVSLRHPRASVNQYKNQIWTCDWEPCTASTLCSLAKIQVFLDHFCSVY